MSIETTLRSFAETSLIDAVSAVLGLARERIEMRESLSAYGFDSITLTQLAHRLNRTFPFVRLDASTFLEYSTLEALRTHLQTRYGKEFETLLGLDRAETPAAPARPAETMAEPAAPPLPASLAPETAAFAGADVSGALLLDALTDASTLEESFADDERPLSSASVPETRPVRDADIAIVGLAGRFPGAEDIVEFWENLCQEKSALGEVPPDRWDWRAIYGDPQAEGNLTDCRYGGFLDRPERFDAAFFGISPLEAEHMDPQQKLVLQAAWETLENAGYTMERLKGQAVGVYLGAQRNENLLRLMKSGESLGPYANIGNTHSMLANRVSYFFDWTGDSLSVDTACSASSSALHLACRALQRGEIGYALVGGVTVVQDPFSHIANRRMGLLTGEPRVCSFDADSGGYLIGEGVATALLKPLAQAEEDGDFIYGVVKGCAVTQSGKTVFLTAPDPKAHVKAIRAALSEAGLRPEDIDYLEGQGTGTELSDKAELKAYAEAFGACGRAGRTPGLGSLKGNIGHVESAAGIASLIKVCMAMQSGVIPPVLNFRKLNWAETEAAPPFEVVAQARAWETRRDARGLPLPRRAGVHNFGYGGLCAHFVIEERADAPEGGDAAPREELLVFSSKSRPQLERYLQRFLRYIQSERYRHFGIRRLHLADLAYTLQTGRQSMDVRLAVVASSVEELVAKLRAHLAGAAQIPRWYAGVAPRAAAERRAIPASLYRGRAWDEIARRWVAGGVPGEQSGLTAHRGRRIPLPTFCFDDGRDAPEERDSAKPQFERLAWRRFSEAFRRLDALAGGLLLERLHAWGIRFAPGETLAPERLKAALGVVPRHERLFGALLEILGQTDPSRPPQAAELARERDALAQDFPELEAQIGMTWDCVHRLREALSGQVAATDILFPGGDMKRAEGFYAGNPLADGYNKLVCWRLVAALEALSRRRAPGETLRVLEIGAGTGGASETALRTAAGVGLNLRYVYSDISPAFLQFGKRKFGQDYPFLEFQTLDIEKDPIAQGYAEESFDLILASNVLHATADMRRTLRNVKRLLKADGGLILNEATRVADHIALTFGLLHGWWAYADAELRQPRGPLLSAATWESVLREAGFATVEFDGRFGPDGEDAGHTVALAANWVQDAQALAPAPTLRPIAPIAEPPAAHNPETAVAGQVLAIFADTLKMDATRIDATAPYIDYGVDSFSAVRLAKEIERALGVPLRNTDLFNFPNVEALSRHIEGRRPQTAPAPAQTATPTRVVQNPAPRIAPATADAPRANAPAAIAVIGFSGRFPQAKDIEEYWRNLAAGKDCIVPVPAGRWEGEGHYGGFLDDVDRFDPLFFNISPKEAEWMDPQQRLFVQEAWRAFEHAGYSSENLKGSRCGVYVGCREGDYLKAFDRPEPNGYQGTGNSASMLAARIAYFLDLKGPCLAVDTACSSSLVALHLACESLRGGDCEMALAGGVSVLCTDETHRVLGKSGMLSPDGRCKTFDDRADGFVPAEAAGVALLKPLEHALRDGDRVYGVIRAHGVNHNGRTNGITASSSPAQSALLLDTYRRFGINPECIGYVEAHGTGTALGDPIEIDALSDSFSAYTSRKGFCAVGSAKTNIGHTLAAAGIAGLIKTLLCLEHKRLPPSLHFVAENRNFELAQTPFYVNTDLRDWDSPDGLPRMAAVSSFGFGGVNAHCVVEEAPSSPPKAASDEATGPWLIALSAKTQADLEALVRALADWLEREENAYPLSAIAKTLLLGRSHFEFRAAAVARDPAELTERLRGWLASPVDLGQKIEPERTHSPALRQFGKRLLAELRAAGLPDEEREESLLSLADLYRRGYALDWRRLYRDENAPAHVFRKIPLPGYPFVGGRYWLAPAPAARTARPAAANPIFAPAPFPPQTPELRDFQHAYAQMSDYCALLLAGALQETGAFRRETDRYSQEELREALRLDPKYRRLLDAFLNILLDAGHLRREGTAYARAEGDGRVWRLSFEDLRREKDRLTAERPQIAAFLNLLWTCARAYPEVLQGRSNATEVMFPGSSFDLVKGIYKENATADFYNRILVDNFVELVKSKLAATDPAQPLQILEIGAGTGGTSALLLEKLQAFGERIVYFYTDISSGFAHYGRRTYGPHYPFARFEVLDIEKPVPADCAYRARFDLIVAANVIHATRNLDDTLGHVKALLKRGGHLFLNEATDVQAFATMTYGLLDGWWLFEDALRLENSPLLDAERWTAFLRRKGFAVAPPQGLSGAAKGPGQHILIARLDSGDLAEDSEAARSASVPAPSCRAERPLAADTAAATDAQSPTAPIAAKDAIRRSVAETVMHILGLRDETEVLEKRFSDYGLDSISGIDFLNEINRKLGIDLRVTALFDYPGVAELSEHIHERYGAGLNLAQPTQMDRVPPPPAEKPVERAPPPPAETAQISAPRPSVVARTDDIAIIGMSGRFSGARDVHEFWDNLAAGVCSVGPPPAGRWPDGSFPEGYRAGFMEGIDRFDPTFFNWSGAEAEQADPQQRIFLEECYAALENAGYPTARLRGLTCGVFAGVGMSDYLMNMRECGYRGEAQTFWGNSPAVAPARISYFLNLKGPSIAIDTACSSSLAAIHAARQSILAGECDMALAGGVFLCTTPHFHTLAERARMLAPDGRCKAFDDSANGFVFGEGAGALVLKRLDAALRDHDYIHGVLKISGVNQDGKTNGIAAPSALSQTELEAAVYERGGIDPETIGYVEAHGTGTKLGDPVEVEALTQAFRRYTDKKRFCSLGSVKPNIGHASLAAGIASVVKVLQCFAHRQIPPLPNFSAANEHIDFADSPFKIDTRLRDWNVEGEQPRRAAVSGFGLSGTNVHLVLEESPALPVSRPDFEEVPVLICLSAKTEGALRQKLSDLAHYLESWGRRHSLGHIAYTLHVGREHFAHRIALVAQSREDLLEQLRRADIAAAPEIADMPAAAVEQWLTRLRTANLPLPEALERLHDLANLYRAGRDIDWESMYASDARYRVPLPAYPFERARFWFSASPQTVAPDVERLWWLPHWLPAPADAGPAREADGPLLLFGDEGQDLSPWQGTSAILALRGDAFSVAQAGTVPGAAAVVRLRPGNPADSRRLVEWLAERGPMPTRILFDRSRRPFLPEDAEAYLDTGFLAVLCLAQALMSLPTRPPRLHILYAFVSTDSRKTALDRAMSGFAKTLNLENSGFFCQTLEVAHAGSLPRLAADEFRRAAPNEAEVRYAQEADGIWRREVKTWRRAEELERTRAQALALKERGTYWLIGGAGGIGLQFCEYLGRQAETQRTRIALLLTGRRALSGETARRIERLRSPWCEIRYVPADIADLQETRRAVASAKDARGGIAGIFHCAGSARDAFLLKKTPEECRATLSAKVRGTLNLESALQGTKVDFVSLFSSASAALGNVGQADYAYANAFLDAFAEQGGIAGSHTFGVNWALWDEGGMKLPADKLETMIARMGVHPLATDDGLRAWETALAAQTRHSMFLSGDRATVERFVATRLPNERPEPARASAPVEDIRRRAETIGQPNRVETQSAPKAPALADIYARADAVGLAASGARAGDAAAIRLAAPSDEASRTEIEAFLRQSVAEVVRLPLDKIGARRPLEEFGLDSLMVAALNEKLLARYGQLPATLFFEYGTLEALAGHLAQRRPTATPPAASAGQASMAEKRPSALAELYAKAEAVGLAGPLAAAAPCSTSAESCRRAEETEPYRPTQTEPQSASCANAAAVSRQDSCAQIEDFLRQSVAEVVRLPLDKIGARRPLEEFGLDSLMVAALNEKLLARYGQLPATLFFEYGTLEALAGHLAERRPPMPAIAAASATPTPEQTKPSTLADIYAKADAVGRVEATLSSASRRATTGAAASNDIAAPRSDARAEIETFLRRAVAEVVHRPVETIGARRPLEEFGLDSLAIAALNEKLIARYGQLPATLFFEYGTLEALAGHLAERRPLMPAAPPAQVGQTDGQSRPAALADIYARADSVGQAAAARVAPADEAYPAGETAAPAARPIPPAAQSQASGVADAAAGEAPFDIAVIGVGGLYPKADTLEEFWENLKAGRDCIEEIPPSRWKIDDYYDPDRNQAMHGKIYCRWGGFVDDIDGFDAGFFNIAPREAKLMDPNERLFLQTAWAACEDAGYTRKRLERVCGMNVGVFAGISSYAYSLWGPQEWEKGNWCTPCGGLWSIANRVSFCLNLNGPSQPVDTACSSSLSAIHMACLSLRNGECAMAIAGGASFNVHPQQYIGMCQNQMLSPSGKCHSFGADADGFVPGEGVGAVLLKPLARAVADGDHIYAVIKSTAINHGGRTNGYAVPNPKAQAELVRRALDRARIDPHTVGYVEAHGTGTALGDPVEFEGLCQAWAGDADRPAIKQYCALGTVKSNIGHLTAAAGISGVTKILLQMRHKTLAPSLHAQKPNPRIDFADSPFYLQHTLAPWTARQDGTPRRAAISSFGVGGANAHAILEEYPMPPKPPQAAGRAPHLLPLSAKTRERLLRYAEKMLAFLEQRKDELDLADFAYTLQTGREAMAERVAWIVESKDDAILQLRAFLNPETARGTLAANRFEGQAEEDAAPVSEDRLAATASASAYAELARLWTRGADVDWDALPCWRNARPARIPLPTYPFAKTPYRYAERESGAPASTAAPANRDAPADAPMRAPEPAAPIEIAPDRPTAAARPQDPARFEERVRACARTLRRIVAEVIEADAAEIDPNRAYVDMGVDSILAIEIVNQANREFGVELRSTAVFDHATVNKLAEHVASRQPDAGETEDEHALLQVLRSLHDGEMDVRAAQNRLGLR